MIKIKNLAAAFLLTQFCFAQISVKSFRQLPMDTDGRIFDRSTPDDDRCALIKVVTPVKNLSFSVGHAFICGDVIQKVGEIWVYVSEEARYMTIHHGQLGVLRRYKIPMPIEPPNTYEMVLQTAKITQIVEEALPGFVVLKSEPSEARVIIDGQEMAGRTPFSKSLKVGRHRYEIRKTLHETVRGSFTIQQGKTTKVSKSLLPAYGTLQVSTTAGAQIYIDRQLAGQGELTKVLAPGRYYVEITKENYFPLRKNVTIEKRKNSRITQQLKIKKGVLELNSNPIEADVYIDNRYVGETPLIKRLAVGNYKLTLKKQGYQPQEINLQITHQKTTRRTITLKEGPTAYEMFRKGYDYNDSRDYKQAAYWYKKAAKLGHAAAQNNLGVLYNNGRGVRKSRGWAKYWYKKACKNGNETACKNLRNVGTIPWLWNISIGIGHGVQSGKVFMEAIKFEFSMPLWLGDWYLTTGFSFGGPPAFWKFPILLSYHFGYFSTSVGPVLFGGSLQSRGWGIETRIGLGRYWEITFSQTSHVTQFGLSVNYLEALL